MTDGTREAGQGAYHHRAGAGGRKARRRWLQAGYSNAHVPVKVTTRLVRVLGISTSIAFAVGLLVGLLWPRSGCHLRAKLIGLIRSGNSAGAASISAVVHDDPGATET